MLSSLILKTFYVEWKTKMCKRNNHFPQRRCADAATPSSGSSPATLGTSSLSSPSSTTLYSVSWSWLHCIVLVGKLSTLIVLVEANQRTEIFTLSPVMDIWWLQIIDSLVVSGDHFWMGSSEDLPSEQCGSRIEILGSDHHSAIKALLPFYPSLWSATFLSIINYTILNQVLLFPIDIAGRWQCSTS